jgi:hypothetical protein
MQFSKELIIQPEFYTQMANILEFGIDLFGAKVDLLKVQRQKPIALF